MLFTILLTIYCTLMYVVGFKAYNVKYGGGWSTLFWLFSPISVPIMFLVMLWAG